MHLLVKGIGASLTKFSPKRKTYYYTQLEDLVYVCSNLQLALSSIDKDISSSSHPWFQPFPSTNFAAEDDLGIDGDNSANDDRDLVNEFVDLNSSVPSALC